MKNTATLFWVENAGRHVDSSLEFLVFDLHFMFCNMSFYVFILDAIFCGAICSFLRIFFSFTELAILAEAKLRSSVVLYWQFFILFDLTTRHSNLKGSGDFSGW